MLFVSNIVGSLIEISDTDSKKVVKKTKEELRNIGKPILGVSNDGKVRVVSNDEILEYLKAKCKLAGTLGELISSECPDNVTFCAYDKESETLRVLYGQTSLENSYWENFDLPVSKIVVPKSIDYVGDDPFQELCCDVEFIDASTVTYWGCFAFSDDYCLFDKYSFSGDNLYIDNYANISIKEGGTIDITCNNLTVNAGAFRSDFVSSLKLNCHVFTVCLGGNREFVTPEDYIRWVEQQGGISIADDLDFWDIQNRDCFQDVDKGIEKIEVSRAVLNKIYFGCYIADIPDVTEQLSEKYLLDEVKNFFKGKYYGSHEGCAVNPSKLFFDYYKHFHPDAKLMRIPESGVPYVMLDGPMDVDVSSGAMIGLKDIEIHEDVKPVCPLRSVVLIEDDGTKRELSLDEYYQMLGIES